MAAANPHALSPGTVIHEYRVDDVLGAGSFGITYKATDTYLGMIVAIKEFFPEEYARRGTAGSVELVASKYADTYQWELDRFIGEGQVLAAFRHPNIVRVWRYFTTNHTAYMVMDYEEGENLRMHLRRLGGAPEENQLRRIFIPVLEGLQEVHSKRYLHRDIKPGNIYIRVNKTPLLLDFGAARLEMVATEGSTSKLTVGYAPIEQYSSNGPQGPALDLYALGATMYRCIAGHTPVESITRRQAVEKAGQDPLTQATQVGRSRYTPDFLETIDWMMRLYPEDRPQSATEVLQRLQGERHAAIISRIHWQRPSVRNYHVVVAGPRGCGQATAIASLSEIPVACRQRHPLANGKREEPSLMDYGLIRLSDTESLHLYGLAGGETPEFPRNLLKQGLLGLILLLDDGREAPLKALDWLLKGFADLLRQTKIAIGITHVDPESRPVIEKYHRHLLALPQPWRINPPIFEVDPASSRDMALLLQALLYSVDPGVEESALGTNPSTGGLVSLPLLPMRSGAKRS